MATITIGEDGCPLSGELTFYGAERDDVTDGAWLIGTSEAAQILEAWRSAPKEDDVTRHWAYFEGGYFTTALTMDGEITIDNWESEGTAIYSTANMPLDLTINEVATA